MRCFENVPFLVCIGGNRGFENCCFHQQFSGVLVHTIGTNMSKSTENTLVWTHVKTN